MASIPIFVSSTFRDFHCERDVLRERVATALDEVLRPLGGRVELLDLRWGVDTTGLDEAAASQHVLDVCIRELDRCRPLFLGLVGDRYGWAPSRERIERAYTHPVAPGALPDVALSVTALEFWHGLLAPSAQADAVVAVRQIIGDAPPGWIDADRSGVGWLRAEISEARFKSCGRIQTIEYRARVAPNGQVAEADMEHLAVRLIALLTPMVRARAEQLGSRQSGYAAAAAFASETRSIRVGREAVIGDSVRALVHRHSGLVLTGRSGVGKSTVLLGICERMRSQGWRVAVVLVGSGPGSTSTGDVIAILCTQLGMRIPTFEDSAGGGVPLFGVELITWWEKQLNRVSEPTLIVVDAIDRMDAGRPRDLLELIPPVRAGSVRFLTSTCLSEQALGLRGRGIHRIAVEPLGPSDAAAAVGALAAATGSRALPPSVVAVLSEKPRSGLWLRLAVTELTWLDRTDFAEAEAASAGGADPGEALTHLLVSEARSLPDQDAALAALLLARASAQLDDDRAAGLLLGALAVTRSGLGPNDLAAIVANESQTGEDGVEGFSALDHGRNLDMQTTRFRQLLGPQLVSRDAAGRLAFDHALIGQAALKASREVGWSEPAIHGRIFQHLASPIAGAEENERQRDLVEVQDWIWHALHAGDADATATALQRLNALSVAERGAESAVDAVADLISAAILAARSNSGMALEALSRLPLAAAGDPDSSVPLMLTEYRHSGDLNLSERRVLTAAALEVAEWALVMNPGDTEASDNFGRALALTGDVLRQSGNFDDALANQQRALEIARRSFSARPDDVRAGRRFAEQLTMVGQLLDQSGKTKDALSLLQESVACLRKLASRHPESLVERELAYALVMTGSLTERAGARSAAYALFAEARGIADRLMAADPDNRDNIDLRATTREMMRFAGGRATDPAADSESLVLARKRVAEDPDDFEKARELILRLLTDGDELEHANRLTEALEYYTEARDIAQRLRATDPEDADTSLVLAVALTSLADILGKSGLRDAARVHYLESMSITKAMAQDDPSNRDVARVLCATRTNLNRLDGGPWVSCWAGAGSALSWMIPRLIATWVWWYTSGLAHAPGILNWHPMWQAMLLGLLLLWLPMTAVALLVGATVFEQSGFPLMVIAVPGFVLDRTLKSRRRAAKLARRYS